MTGFLAAFVATFLLGMGGRDQVLIAGLSASLGRRASLLAASLFAAALTSFAAVWIAASIAGQIGPDGTHPLAALALGLAGLDLVLSRRARLPQEPTRSLGAITLVLLAFQAADAVRLASFALALVIDRPLLAGLGAPLGSMAALAAGWRAGARVAARPLAEVRRWCGIAVIAASGTLLLILR